MQAIETKLLSAAKSSLTESNVPAAEAAAFIEIILLLIPVFINLIKNCTDNPETVAKKAANPGFGIRFLMRVKIRREVPGFDAESEQAREVLFQAVLAAGKEVTADDVKALAG